MPSIASGSATPSSKVRIASFNIGHKILLDTKPGESLQDRAILPIFSAASTTEEFVASLVWSPLIISTSFIIGTGFMKCIPMTFSGRLVALAMVEIEIDEVLEARIHSGLQILSNSENIDVFKSNISGTASTTKSTSAHSPLSVVVDIRASVSSASDWLILSFETNLLSDF